MNLTDQWLAKIKQTMAVDAGIAMQHQMPPAALIEFLFRIPEVAQAFHLRARGKLDIAIDTPEGQAIAAERLTWAADFLDDGFHEGCVAKLREVAGDLSAQAPAPSADQPSR